MDNFARFFLYAGLTKESYEQCLPEIRQNNRRRLDICVKVAIVFTLAMSIICYKVPVLHNDMGMYMVSLLLCALVIPMQRFIPKDSSIALASVMYYYIIVVYAMSICIDTMGSQNESALGFCVFMVVIPLLFTLRPIQIILNTFIAQLAFAICELSFNGVSEASQVNLIKVTCYGVLSIIVSCYVVKTTTESFAVSNKLSTIAVTDLSTGIQNRNAYESQYSNYPTMCSGNISCVYVDANGLHEINNSLGHEAGDKMLQKVAKKLCEKFGSNCCYRIGGDEFIALVVDRDSDTLYRMVDELEEDVEKEGYHVAVGVASHSAGGVNMDDLIKQAEQRMYVNKTEYYKLNGIDER